MKLFYTTTNQNNNTNIHSSQLYKWNNTTNKKISSISTKKVCSNCPTLSLIQDNTKYNAFYISGFAGTSTLAEYILNPLKQFINLYKIFTVGVNTEYSTICPLPKNITNEEFHYTSIYLISQIVKKMTDDLDEILINQQNIPVILISHSLGYVCLTLLYTYSKYLKKIMDNPNSRLILLDPTGDTSYCNISLPLIKDSLQFRDIAKKTNPYNSFYEEKNFKLTWYNYVYKNLPSLFTENEKKLNEFFYIQNSYLNGDAYTLSMIAYAINYLCFGEEYNTMISNLGTKIKVIIPKNSPGCPPPNLESFSEIVSDAGHYFFVFKQKETLDIITKFLNNSVYNKYLKSPNLYREGYFNVTYNIKPIPIKFFKYIPEEELVKSKKCYSLDNSKNLLKINSYCDPTIIK
tara:strand:- start:311 stop:1522 length:1212 start_codon:yes stop_codon:yes gene_type:complete